MSVRAPPFQINNWHKWMLLATTSQYKVVPNGVMKLRSWFWYFSFAWFGSAFAPDKEPCSRGTVSRSCPSCLFCEHCIQHTLCTQLVHRCVSPLLYYVNAHIVDTLLKGCRRSFLQFNRGRLSDTPDSSLFPSIAANGSAEHQEVKQGHGHTMYRFP